MRFMSYVRPHRKTRVYWFRQVVPAALRAIIGKREIKKSLRTKDPREAKRLGIAMAAEVERLFASARAGVNLSLADAEALAQVWKAEALAESAEQFATDTTQRAWGEIEELVEVGDAFTASERRDIATGVTNLFVVAEAKKLLAKQAIALPEDSPSFRRLCFALHRALVEVQEVNGERTRGVWRSEAQTPVTTIVAPTLSPLGSPRAPSRRLPNQEDAPLASVLTIWAKDRNPRPKTLSEWRTAVRRFNESVGTEVMVRDITKAHVRKFTADMLAMPYGLSQKMRAKMLPAILREVGDDPEVRRIDPATVLKYFSALQTLLTKAIQNDLAETNPFDGLKPSAPRDGRELRLPYSDDDLKLIFERSPLYAGCRSPQTRLEAGDLVIRDARFWLPLLGLFTGARLDELGQLLLSDCRREQGIDFLDLNTLDEDKRLKNASSRRRVPVHPELVRCGFLRYVEELRARGERQVFPELRPDSRGGWTAPLSKFLNRYMRQIGLTDRRKVIHSLRHAFKDACRRARIAESVHDALTGHTNGSVSRKYGSGEPLDVLAEALASISYPLHLDHLHVSGARRLHL